MSFVDGEVRVRVPATSANLGPGFDALGLALTLFDEVTASVIDSGIEIVVEGEGADTVPTGEDHLVYQAMVSAFDLLGETPPGVRLECKNRIPHGRGLGSSSAAIAAGIIAARALVVGGEERLDAGSVYQLATDLEGHPDNVAPALHGGFTIAWISGAAAEVERLEISHDVTVFVPPSEVSTKTARGLLPEVVPFGDAAANVGRAALMVAALVQSPERLIFATEDRLHQSYRSTAMPDSYKLMQQMRVEGIPAVISGAGPTVLAFGHGLTAWVPEGWAAHELSIESRGARVF
ncbi:MAG: homoserine kinase [Aeromicrobium sp.]|nr:MAG: homoserine kinase [Aeromicrobium sp.]